MSVESYSGIIQDFRTIWDYMGPFKTIWDHFILLGTYAGMQKAVDVVDTVRANLFYNCANCWVWNAILCTRLHILHIFAHFCLDFHFIVDFLSKFSKLKVMSVLFFHFFLPLCTYGPM